MFEMFLTLDLSPFKCFDLVYTLTLADCWGQGHSPSSSIRPLLPYYWLVPASQPGFPWAPTLEPISGKALDHLTYGWTANLFSSLLHYLEVWSTKSQSLK